LRATVICAATIVFILLFGIYGLFLAVVVTPVVMLFFFRSRKRLDGIGPFSISRFIGLVRWGLPVTALDMGSLLLRTSDRLIIAYFLGLAELGYYGIAIIVFGFCIEIPWMARDVIEPRLMEHLAEGDISESAKEYFLKPLVAIAYLMPFVLGLGVIALPVLIPLVLPGYVPGIMSAQIIALGSYFLCVSFLARAIIVAGNGQFKALFLTGATIIINVVLSLLAIKAGYGIAGVALASAVSYFILFLMLLSLSKRVSKISSDEWRASASALIWPFPVMCASLYLLSFFHEATGLNIYISMIIEWVIFLGVMLATLQVAKGRYEIMRGMSLTAILKKK
jgi:O-antigen/teichoic acid export membrane protein